MVGAAVKSCAPGSGESSMTGASIVHQYAGEIKAAEQHSLTAIDRRRRSDADAAARHAQPMRPRRTDDARLGEFVDCAFVVAAGRKEPAPALENHRNVGR